MTTQTEAQQIADKLEEEATFDIHHEAKACMTNAAAELLRLGRIEHAWQMWQDKTEWVQKTSEGHELGMHRADALRQRIERLEAANAELLDALVEVLDYACCERTSSFWDHFDRVRNKARAAIKNHGGAA